MARLALPTVLAIAIAAALSGPAAGEASAAAVAEAGASAAGASVTAAAASGANPIRRVVTLLQKMAEKVDSEGKKEEELYEKFHCHCKTNGEELTQSIADSTAKVPQVQSDIESSQAELQQLQLDLKSHQEDRSGAKAAMESATSQREGEHAEFVKASDQYKSFISSLGRAVDVVSKGMAGGFLQTASGALLRRAVAADGSVTEYDRQLVTSFLTGGEASADGQGYVPKSGEITGILNQIKDDFEKTLAETTATEEEAVKLYEELMAAKTKQVAALSESVEKKTGKTGELRVSVVNMKNELTEEEAELVADKKFATDLEESCDSKAAEWEERKKLRAEELQAIHEAIKILNDDDALDLFKKTLESPSLLQLQASRRDLQQRALAAVLHGAAAPGATTGRRNRAGAMAARPELDFIALALSGRKADFTKVITMIDNMVSLLKKEQEDDNNKKEYCETTFDVTEDKVKDLKTSVSDLEASLEEKKEAISTLTTEIKALTDSVAALDKEVADATDMRKKEHEEYTELISSNSAAKKLIEYAKNRLNKFYNPSLYKTTPAPTLNREEEIYSNFGGTFTTTLAGGIAGTGVEVLAQISRHQHQQQQLHAVSRRRAGEAPPPSPTTWGAYASKGQENTGVISIMDLLIRDLDKEMTEAETSEKESQKDYESLMSDAARRRAAEGKSITSKEKTKADLEEDKTNAEAEAKSKSADLMATEEYLMEVHKECDWMIQNFELRKQARADEAESLASAKAVLSGADFSLAQQGKSPTRAVAARRLLRGIAGDAASL